MKRKAFVALVVNYTLFFTAGAALALAPWPQFRGNPQHTAQSLLDGPQRGALSWSYVTGTFVSSSPAIGSDGALYVGSYDDRLYSLTSTGAFSWSYRTGGNIFSSPAIGSDGTLYVGSALNWNLYAFTSTGALSWSYVALWHVESSPAIGSDGTVYVGMDFSLYSLTSTGAFSWTYGTWDKIISSPAIGSDGDLYMGSQDNRLYCITSTGALSWSYETGDEVNSSPAISSDGTVYVGSDDNRIYGLTSTGDLSWTYVTGDRVFSSPAIGFDGKVYVGSTDRRLYSLTSTGSLSWSYVTGDEVDSSPAIGFDGKVYVGSDDNRLYSLTSTGGLSWSYVTGYEVVSSPAIGWGWKVYVGSADFRLYCFQNPTVEKLALLVRQGANDLNIYFWNVPDAGDWTQWDALARNPSPLARDFWQIPIGNDGIGLTSIDIAGDDLALLVRQASNDLNIYFWNAPDAGDWTQWDALARNPSPLARDFWQIPIGNDGIGLTKIDISDPPDGNDDIALLVRQASNDLNIYFWNSPEAGDWTRWDALARNPSPLARDFWQIPIGNDGIGLTAIDIDGNDSDEIALLVRQGVNDLNVYFWNAPVAGDWTRWDALARNPSPLARDFWQIPIGNDGIGITAIDVDGTDKDKIGLLVRQGANDLNIYFWNAPVPGDWTRWDALARNPSPLARDFWQIPIGNDGIGLTGIGM